MTCVTATVMVRPEAGETISPDTKKRVAETALRGFRQTPQFDRVRALHWCPKCKCSKSSGLLVCWSCNTRLKRAYDGTYGPLERLLPRLDEYLFDHNESAALSWLGEA